MRKKYAYPTLTDFGFSCHIKEGKLIVCSLSARNIVAKDGLCLKDQIIEFNGVDYNKMSLIKWSELLGGKSESNTMDLTVLRNGKKLNINLTSEILLE